MKPSTERVFWPMLAALLVASTVPSFLAAEESSNNILQPPARDVPASGWIAKPFSENAVVSVEVNKSSPGISGPGATLKLNAKGTGDAAGELSQFVDAAPFRGKIVLLRADVSATLNAADPSAHVTLLISAHGKSGAIYPWVRTRVRATGQWTNANVPLAVPDDADKLEVNLWQGVPGKSSIGETSLTPIAAESVGWEAPKPLSLRGLANLHAFARLLGYVRFFHPSDQAAAANWDDVAIAGVQRVESAPDSSALAQALREVFAPLAPTLRIYQTHGPVPATPSALLDATDKTAVGWLHHGVLLDDHDVSKFYADARVAMEPKDVFTADLGGGVSIRMPTTLYKDDEGTLPHATLLPLRPGKPALFVPSGMDRTTRLADVVLSWNVFQNFYPDFEEEPVDWPGILDLTLKKAATDRDETEFLNALSEEVAALRDGHADATDLQDTLNLPLLWDWIDGKLVVLRVGTGVKELRAGDVIDRIDHRPVADVVADWMPRISAATPQHRQLKLILKLLVRTSAAPVTLDAHGPDGNTISEQIAPGESSMDWTPFDSLEPVTQMKPGIWYVDLRRLDKSGLEASLNSLAAAKVIIADVRGYPTHDVFQFMAHVSAKPIATGQIDGPVVTLPDRMNVTYEHLGWSVTPASPTFGAKFIFLTNAWALSMAELVMGMVQDNHLGLIMGSTTDGVDGERNSFGLPGDYRLFWTGMRVRNLDGSRFFGVGIVPNIRVEPTIAGIAAGRDEVLEKALSEAEHEQ